MLRLSHDGENTAENRIEGFRTQEVREGGNQGVSGRCHSRIRLSKESDQRFINGQRHAKLEEESSERHQYNSVEWKTPRGGGSAITNERPRIQIESWIILLTANVVKHRILKQVTA